MVLTVPTPFSSQSTENTAFSPRSPRQRPLPVNPALDLCYKTFLIFVLLAGIFHATFTLDGARAIRLGCRVNPILFSHYL